MYKLLLLGFGGLLGTLVRYWLSGVIARRVGETFPFGTLTVNLLGCLVIGLLYFWLEERFLVDPVIRTAILIGLLGGFTTFSSYGLQAFTLVQDGEFLLAGLYVTISNLIGLFLVWFGYSTAKLLSGISL